MMNTRTADERRRDLVLRDIVSRCQPDLEQRGFRLDGRGCAGPLCWVRFGCHTYDDGGQNGTLVLLVAHDKQERAVLVESRFADDSLAIDTPRRKRIQRYDAPMQLPQVARETIEALCTWPGGP